MTRLALALEVWEVPKGTRAEIDPATLEACRAGNPVATRAFVERYQRTVFAFLSRALGRGPHVEDLAQEVFLRAWRALPRFEPGGSARVSTWLLTIARRLAVDARRRARRMCPAIDELADIPGNFDP